MHAKQTELKARLERLGSKALPDEGNPNSAQNALRHQMSALLEGADSEGDFLGALRIAVATEHLDRILQELERRNLKGSNMLEFAASAARSGYRDAQRALRSVDARRMQAERWPLPVVLFEPMATPMTLNRGATAGLSFTGGRANAIPFPLVFIPDYPETSFGSLCVVQHEIGHNVDEDFGLSEAIESVLVNRLTQLDARDVDVWVAWTRELVADLFGLMLGGTALALELVEWAQVLSDDAALASGTHPYPSIRVELAIEILKHLGVQISAELKPLLEVAEEGRTDESSRLLKQVPLVAKALMCSPIPQLNHTELRDLAPWLPDEHGAIMSSANHLLDGSIDAALNTLPYRLLPSVARTAVSLGGDAVKIFELLADIARKRKDETAPRFRQVIFTKHLKDIKPPILDEENEGIKRPPTNLFWPVKDVSFVGGTNDGLPSLFSKYAKSGNQRKKHINVFFLTETALQGLAHANRTVEEVVDLRKQSLRALTPELMNSVAESWRLFEHDEPFFFASYWDAAAAGGRIHVSSHGWELDIKAAPAVDHVWPNGAIGPNRKYRWYLDALSGLFLRARVIKSGSKEHKP